MSGEIHPPRPERDQTDESLRLERERADQTLGEELAAIDEAADLVINRARHRADRVLAAARAKTDGEAATRASGTPHPAVIERERARADQILEEERAIADETLRDERADQVALLSRERKETDSDLATERARADGAVATRDEFLGVVSHDLRNMLSAIIGSAELIVHEVALPHHEEPIRLGALRIQRSATRMNRLVGDLVDVASIDVGRLAVTLEAGDPAAVVNEAVESLAGQAAANGVTVITEITAPPMLLSFDSARLFQVLINLLSNATKFTPSGGTVHVLLGRGDAEMRFAVSDTGPGIPPAQLETVFERFVQLTRKDRRGVGLGLYISRAIVQGHGGRIWAENKATGGTTFCFTLPITTRP
jgi:signal transduction histidine kinase